MKTGYFLSIAMVPLFLVGTPLLDQKEKGNKENGNKKTEQHDHSSDKGGHKNNGNDDRQGNRNDNDDRKVYKNGNDKAKNYGNAVKRDRDDDNRKEWKNDNDKNDKAYKNRDNDDRDYNGKDKGNWKNEKWDDNRFEARMKEIKEKKRKDWVNDRDYRDVRWWDGDRYVDAKSPKSNRKVTLCHKPNGSDYPVTINVSENALKAHLNHGDSRGECRDFDRSVYSDDYWNARNDYYNQYYLTTETLSFGEQLLLSAVQVLTNKKTQLVSLRPTLTVTELRAREDAVLRLQNSVYNLQNSLAAGNDRVLTINVNF